MSPHANRNICRECDNFERTERRRKAPHTEVMRNLRRRLLYQIRQYGRTLEPQEMYRNRYAAAREFGKRSGLEVAIERQMQALGIPFLYEPGRIPYSKPHHYIPDFILPNGIVVEAKGHFESSDRGKIKAVLAQYPDLDFRMVFSNSRTKIAKKSKTTYGKWCETLGIKYADGLIPASWFDEPIRSAAVTQLIKLGLVK